MTAPASTSARPGPTSGEYFFPASSAQHRLWFLEQFQPGRALYNIPIAVRMTGPLHVAVLERALNELIARHESLRTSFALQQNQPVQIVAPALPFRLSVTDLRLLPAEAREAQACALARAEARRPFNLSHPPLFSIQLLKLADTDHIFLLTVHHIIFDGWSLTVFFRELAALCTAGHPPALPELTVQYGDFTVWQRERFKSLSSRLAWWKDRLAGSPPVLELPTDRPRPAVQGYHGRVETLALPADLREPLEALSRREGATLFMTLLAAFQVLLHRHTGQTDLLIGTPVAGRNRAETESVLGLFINTLVLRGDLSGNPTFRELLGRVRTTVLDALAHEEVPFEKLVEKLSPTRSLSRAPLFQVMFVHERAPLEPVSWPGLQLTQLELDSGTSKFDLTLYLVESAHGLTARAEYDSDLFEPGTIRRLLAHLAVLLRGAANTPDQCIAGLPVLTDPERRQLISDWNHTAAAYPRDQTIHGLIVAQAGRTPDAIAVTGGGQTMTYRQLLEESGRLARRLQAEGVKPGVLVGLCVDRTPVMLVSLLGILQAGGAYVPLDPTFPKDRLAFMLEDSQAPVIVTERNWLELLPQTGAKFICLDDPSAGSAPAAPAPVPPARPADLAYVIYTSGSTGRPKGVQIPHSAVVNFLCSMQHTPGLAASDVLLAVTTLSFDIAALELYLPLTVGARIVLASRAEAADAARLTALIAASGATVMQATPATWRMLVAAGWNGVKNLRVFCGGEGLPRDLADRLLKRCTELWNLYGPTETTIWSTVARVESGVHPVVIGRPIANTQVHLLDRGLQLVPVGVPGELCIGGDGLARGYLHRPELTAEKFIPDPFNPRPHARLYRTGDLARRLPNGEVELIGRLDHQVKIRGFRIELGEIEAALRLLPGIREAVVLAREDTPGDQQLVAYLAAEAAAAAPGELRRRLRETLPDYMIPTALVRLDRMPLTPNGKINRQALPPPAAGADTAPAAGSGALREGLETSIAAVWSEVLKVKHPGADDNFFDLGGHSLRVALVQTKLRERLGIELPMLALFQYPTIRSLARCIGEKPGESQLHQHAAQRAQRQRAALARKPQSAHPHA